MQRAENKVVSENCHQQGIKNRANDHSTSGKNEANPALFRLATERSGWLSLARSGFFSLFPQVDQQCYFVANMNHKNLFSEENRKTHNP